MTVGRKSRKRAQTIATTEVPVEMVKPRAYDTMSPVSPASALSWRNLYRVRSRTASLRSARSNIGSPATKSVASFDTSVVEQDRQRQQDALAQMYEHVYAQGARRLPVNTTSSDAQPASPTRDGQPLSPSRLQPFDSGALSPVSPTSPTSYYGVLPPSMERDRRLNLLSQLSPQYHPTSPTGQPQSPVRVNQGNRGGPSCSESEQNTATPPSKLQKMRRSVKDRILTINPIPGGFRGDNHDGIRTPLSPTQQRNYSELGTPLEPPSAQTFTPGTGRSFPFGEGYDDEYDVIRAIPPAHPQRPTLTISPPKSRSSPVSSTSHQLPLRQFAEQQRVQQDARDLPSYMSSAGSLQGLGSPGPTKTTVLETLSRPAGPLTGVQTPYSAYMPGTFVFGVFSPMETRKQRKQREKEERATRGALAEEDQVADDSDMWGDVY